MSGIQIKIISPCPDQVDQLIGVFLYTKNGCGLTPGQGTHLGCGFNPQLGYIQQETD